MDYYRRMMMMVHRPSTATTASDATRYTFTEAVYDASTLGIPKMIVLGFQHLFAMFGATVLVPTLVGLNVSNTLLFAGLGTLLFHFITKRKVPAFLGSSFAFLAGYYTIAPNAEKELLPYACLGVFFSGILYLILALIIKVGGIERIMKYFPPIVTGPIIIAIGLTLSQSAVNNCSKNWFISCISVIIVISCNDMIYCIFLSINPYSIITRIFDDKIFYKLIRTTNCKSSSGGTIIPGFGEVYSWICSI